MHSDLQPIPEYQSRNINRVRPCTGDVAQSALSHGNPYQYTSQVLHSDDHQTLNDIDDR